MKKLLIFISLFFSIVYTTTAQSVTANQFNGRLQMTAVNNVSDSTWSITGYFTNSVNKYTATQIAVNDKFFCQIGANTYVGRISVINSASDVTKLITFRVICNYPNPPNNIGAIVRATSNGYPVFVDGLPNALQAGIQNYFATLVNTNAAGSPCEQTITQATHGFRDFTPVRWNSNTSRYERSTNDTIVPDYIVVDSLTANTFKVANCGTYTTSLANGLYWFTSASPGYSLTADTTKVPLFQALNGKLILNPIVGFNLMSGGGSGSGITDLTGDVTASGTGSVVATVANNAITSAKIASQTVDSLDLKNRSITTVKIEDNAVTSAKVASQAIDSLDIKNRSITTVKIADDAITSAKIASQAVDSLDIKNRSITTVKILDGAITDVKVTSLAFSKLTSTPTTLAGYGITADLTINSTVLAGKGPGSGNALNTRFGASALNVATSSTGSTAFGYQSLLSLTSGSYNTGLGLYAGANVTTGTNNTAVGAFSLFTSSTGTLNTAVGYGAVRALTTGSENTGIGNAALTVATTGHSNTAIGSEAQSSLTTGFYNTSAGWYAMKQVTTGDRNTGFGAGTLSDVGTGSRNSALGFLALDFNKGDDNTSVGAYSIQYTLLGHRNTAVGANALQLNKYPNDNTVVGFESLNGDHRRTDSTIAMGSRVQYTGFFPSTNLNKSIVIGNFSGSSKLTGDSTLRNATMIGTSITNNTDNVAIIGTASQSVVFGNGGGSTSARNAAGIKVGSIYFNTDVGAYQVSPDGTNYYNLSMSLKGAATLDFASTAAGAVTDLTITVTGAADGDVVSLSVPNASQTTTGSFSAWVSATNTVTVRYRIAALVGSEDPASGTFKVTVTK